MKTKIVISVVVLVIVCVLGYFGKTKYYDAHVAQTVMQTQKADSLVKVVDSLGVVISNTPDKNASLNEHLKKQANLQAWGEKIGLGQINITAINANPIGGLNPQGIEDFADGSNDTADLGYTCGNIAGFLNRHIDSTLTTYYENPANLNLAFQSVKPFIGALLTATKTKGKVKVLAARLFPYFNCTAPKENLAAFGTLFAKYGNDNTVGFYEIKDKPEWDAAKKATKIQDDDNLEQEYKAWLFVDRHYNNAARKGNGMPLLKKCAEITDFLQKL